MADHVTDQNFQQEVLKSSLPVFVDFYATWCGPCQMMSPTIDDLSKEYEGKIKVVKLDVDANPNTAQQYQVMSIPTMFIFKNGQIVEQLVGYQEKSKLKEKFDNLK